MRICTVGTQANELSGPPAELALSDVRVDVEMAMLTSPARPATSQAGRGSRLASYSKSPVSRGPPMPACPPMPPLACLALPILERMT